MKNQTAGLPAERAISEARLTAETNETFSPSEKQQMGVGARVHLLLVEHLLCVEQWAKHGECHVRYGP